MAHTGLVQRMLPPRVLRGVSGRGKGHACLNTRTKQFPPRDCADGPAHMPTKAVRLTKLLGIVPLS